MGSFQVKEVSCAWDDDFFEALEEEIVHALEHLKSSRPISVAVERKRGDRRGG